MTLLRNKLRHPGYRHTVKTEAHDPRSRLEPNDGRIRGSRPSRHGSLSTREFANVSQGRVQRLTWMLLVVSVLAIPLVVWLPARDSFRVPKEIFARAAVISTAAVLGISILFSRHALQQLVRGWRTHKAVLIPCAGIVIWSLITTITSTNRTVSLYSLIWLLTATLFFVLTLFLSKHASLLVPRLLMIPLIVNSVTAVLQEFRIWSPFRFKQLDLSSTSGFVGNPNDLGAYLVPVALTVTAFALIDRRKVTSLLLLLLAIGGLLASQTATAIVAFSVGAITMHLIAPGRRNRLVPRILVAGLILALSLAFLASATYRQRAHRMVVGLASGDLDDFLSGRILPFTAALYMAVEYPLFGVGPGCFSWQYFDYKIRVAQDHPLAAESELRGTNYREVHNEYLQVSAETGMVGLFLLLSSLIVVGRITVSLRDSTDLRRQFARLLALPLSLSLATLALGGFPLHLAAPCITYLFLAAVCCSWAKL